MNAFNLICATPLLIGMTTKTGSILPNMVFASKPTISLRLSPDTLRKAKQYGKGYTSFLSRLLDAAINDEELVRKCI